MQVKHTPSSYEPVLLLDPEMDRATSLATQLELIGFPTRTESTGAAAPASIDDLTGRLAAFQLRARPLY